MRAEGNAKIPTGVLMLSALQNRVERVPVQRAFLFFRLSSPVARGTWESGYFVTRRRLKSLSANLVWESRVLLCSPAGEISLCGIALHTLWLDGRRGWRNALRRLFCQYRLNIYIYLGWGADSTILKTDSNREHRPLPFLLGAKNKYSKSSCVLYHHHKK